MLKIIYRNLSTQTTPSVKSKILEKLNKKFGTNLICAQVNNLNWKNNEPKESEKFLEVVVVTTEFEGILKQKRLELITSLLKDEDKDRQITYKLLTPSKWYDSNQRGLKLEEVYAEPPVVNGKLLEIAKQFYSNKTSSAKSA